MCQSKVESEYGISQITVIANKTDGWAEGV